MEDDSEYTYGGVNVKDLIESLGTVQSFIEGVNETEDDEKFSRGALIISLVMSKVGVATDKVIKRAKKITNQDND